MLRGGKIKVYMEGNLLQTVSAAEQNVPVVEVAAIFQKDPQIIMAHPESGLKTFGDLAKLKSMFIGLPRRFTLTVRWSAVRSFAYASRAFCASLISNPLMLLNRSPFSIPSVPCSETRRRPRRRTPETCAPPFPGPAPTAARRMSAARRLGRPACPSQPCS